ncbi:MAG: hypothetical protein D6795_11045, partial [Deltaproteobacteria bacterium]
RTRLFFQARRRGIEPLPTESIFAIIEEIRARYPEVYTHAADPEIAEILERWQNPASRRELIREDLARRQAEGRLRQRRRNEA